MRLEGTYRLLLGESATVTGFSYYNGETKVVGEVFEKQDAAQVYETVTGLGRDPGLLEQAAEGTFTFRLFPIEPGERKRVAVHAEQWLRRVENRVEFRAPLAREDGEIDVLLEDERELGAITSTSHELEVTKLSPQKVRVHASKRRAQGDFVLRYTLLDPPWTLHTAVHRDPGQDAFVSVSLPVPHSKKQAAPKDLTLVIDHSGSMSGAPLESARQAASGIIRRLSTQDSINVIAFDDGVSRLFDAPKAVTEETRREALDYVSNLQEAGGTDIAGALQAALDAQNRGTRQGVVLFLTDGESDAKAALEVAAKAPSRLRVYTLGLGAGVQKPLLNRLAKTMRGRFTFIPDVARLEGALSDLYDSIEAPLWTDLSVSVSGARFDRVYPKKQPDLFYKDELHAMLRVHGSGTVRVVVEGTEGGQRRKLEKTITLAPTKKPWVGRLWAGMRVEDLLEEVALSGERPELENEAVELALAYGLVTPYTSFLALPESEITDDVRDAVATAREKRARILAAHPDAVALSRQIMPPGDPVLRVRAPRDARQVTALFPFELVLDLAYDPSSEQWLTRFLVPNDVVDGTYEVEVLIVERDGTTRIDHVPFEIDSRAPEFTVQVREVKGRLQVDVEANEALREVRASFEGATLLASRNERTCNGVVCELRKLDEQSLSGTFTLPEKPTVLRLVVTDQARNETVRRVAIVPTENGLMAREMFE